MHRSRLLLTRRRRARRPPILSLLTDFGDADGFVGQMKAVILGIAPRVRIVDLSHQIPAQDITAAALLFEAAIPAFPGGAIHVGVVDPGVGSSRRAIVASSRTALFVAPDNGLLTPVLRSEPGIVIREIRHPLLRREPTSSTFHGRDVFAVTGARLASGFPFEQVGPRVPDPVLLNLPEPAWRDGTLFGEVVAFDRFGNAASNILRRHLQSTPMPVVVAAAGQSFGPLRRYYAEAPAGAPVALWNSADRIELAVSSGSAATLGLKIGTPVEVRSSERSTNSSID